MIEVRDLERVLLELGALLLNWRESGLTAGEWHGAQLKAEGDQKAHAFLIERLGLVTPDVPVISEEDAVMHEGVRPSCYWLIDPIDGTASWVEGFVGFVTQAALMVDHVPVLCAIYAPALDRMYSASAGGGAKLNGVLLERKPRLGRRQLIDNYPEPRGIAAAAFSELDCSGYLECGSLALKMCFVASGEADLFIKDIVVRDWDMAAPALVLREAGGSFRRLTGDVYKFTGPMDKHGGIIAAADERELQRASAWYLDGVFQ